MRRALLSLLAALALLVPVLALPSSAAARGPAITGRAVDAAGNPVPGAMAVVVQPGGGSPGDTAASVRAGEDGRFVLPAGRRPDHYVVGICLPADAEAWSCGSDRHPLELLTTYVGTDGPQPSLLHVGGYHAAGGSGPVDLGDVPLAEASTVRVTTDASADVFLSGTGPGQRMWRQHEDGVTTFEGVRPGRYRVEVHWQHGGYGRFGDWGRDVRVGPGVTTVDLTGSDATVAGTVRVDGQAAAGVSVSIGQAGSSWGAVRTNADGSYTFSGVEPSDRPVDLRFGGGRDPQDFATPVVRRIPALEEGSERRIDVSLRTGGLGSVTGRAPGMHVLFDLYRADGSRVGDVWTKGARRTFTVPRLAPGTYRVHGDWYDRSKPLVRAQAWRTFEVRAGRTTRLGVLRKKPANRTLVVRAPAGTSVELTGGAPGWAQQQEWQPQRVGPRGRFVMHDLVRGTYRVTLHTDRTRHLPPATRTVQVGRRDVRIRMRLGPRAGSLRGVLVDRRTGKSWPWRYGFAQVTCRRGGSGPAHTAPVYPRPDGAAFELTRLRAGRYACRVVSRAAAESVLPYHLTMDQTFHVRAGQRTSVRVPVGITGG